MARLDPGAASLRAATTTTGTGTPGRHPPGPSRRRYQRGRARRRSTVPDDRPSGERRVITAA